MRSLISVLAASSQRDSRSIFAGSFRAATPRSRTAYMIASIVVCSVSGRGLNALMASLALRCWACAAAVNLFFIRSLRWSRLKILIRLTDYVPGMSKSTERVRAYRRRRSRGLRCVTVRLCEADIDMLVATDYLAAAERQDAEAIKVATEMFIYDKRFECGQG